MKGTKKLSRTFVAISGGVDSSVAALLLKEQGYEVVGVFMLCFNVDGCSESDAEDARRAAEKMGIPFYVWDFEKEYRERVVQYMIDGYRLGITPNPDVMCNRQIKFGLFLNKALEMGARYIATGHYVRIISSADNESHGKFSNVTNSQQLVDSKQIRYSLMSALDLNKDQSYFLWTLTQDRLKHCLFPIGDYLKSEVRQIARQAGLPTAEKKDSQGICFLGQVALRDFLKDYLPGSRGFVFNVAGEKVGEHNGAHFYTIGQRHGLNLGVRRRTSSVRKEFEPYYIAKKDVISNTVIVAEGRDSPALYRSEVSLKGVNFINPTSDLRNPISILARIRYRQPLTPAILTFSNSRELESAEGGASVELAFKTPQRFIAPGQSAVFYSQEGEMLGGGIIA